MVHPIGNLKKSYQSKKVVKKETPGQKRDLLIKDLPEQKRDPLKDLPD